MRRNSTSSSYTLLDGGPILSTRPGKWDATRVSNPAAVIYPNGSVVLAYRGNGKGRGGVGVAVAPHWKGPYTHLYDEPLFSGYAEDPTLYVDANGIIHMIAHGASEFKCALFRTIVVTT